MSKWDKDDTYTIYVVHQIWITLLPPNLGYLRQKFEIHFNFFNDTIINNEKNLMTPGFRFM